jgi:hypothetical protein
MPFGRKDIYSIVGYFVDQAVLFVDSARPLTRKVMFQSFGISSSGVWMFGKFFQELYQFI